MVGINKLKRRAIDLAGSRYISLCPSDVNYLQWPEIWVAYWRQGLTKNLTFYCDGDWDKEVNAKVFWSSFYEYNFQDNYSWKSQSGMLPLKKYLFYSSLEGHFLKGLPWEQTEWYEWMRKRALDSKVGRYEDLSRINGRLRMIEKMFDEFRDGNYQIDRPYPIVNIGRRGKLAIEDGRHRLCLAKIAGVDQIKAKIGVAHRDILPSHLARLFPIQWRKMVDRERSKYGDTDKTLA